MSDVIEQGGAEAADTGAALSLYVPPAVVTTNLAGNELAAAQLFNAAQAALLAESTAVVTVTPTLGVGVPLEVRAGGGVVSCLIQAGQATTVPLSVQALLQGTGLLNPL